MQGVGFTVRLLATSSTRSPKHGFLSKMASYDVASYIYLACPTYIVGLMRPQGYLVVAAQVEINFKT